MAAEAPSGGQKVAASPGAPDLLVGRVINDRYRIVGLIARGGMGKVYRAEQAPLGRAVALKVLNPNYSGDTDPEFHRRFFLEASTTAKLTHPNTVSIFDYGRTDDDIYYIAMELLEGKTLHRALREAGSFDAGRALHVARQICRSLREAHGLGVIHRDLKPANVFLVRHGDENDFVKVLDFGLVKNLEDKGEDLTQTGLFMGSPKYMSPEQIRGERVDGRADIYALGVIMYEMLVGKVPFDRPNSVNTLMAHVHEAPPSLREMSPQLAVPPILEQIVMKTLAKRPDDRFASMEELLLALKQVSGDAGAFSQSHDAAMSGEFVNPYSSGAFSSSGPQVSITGEPLMPHGPMTPSHGFGAGSVSITPQPVTAPAPARPSSRVPLVVAMISLLAVLGVGLAALGVVSLGTVGETATVTPADLASMADPATADAPVATPEPAPEPAADRPSHPVAPEVVTTMVSLRSLPSGAMVRTRTASGEERTYGPTPADIEWTGADAERGREVTFVFEMEGHRDFSVTRTISGAELAVSAELEEDRAARRIPNRSRETSGSSATGGSVAPVRGFKLDPY